MELDHNRLVNSALAAVAAAAHRTTGDVTATGRQWIRTWIEARLASLAEERKPDVAVANLLAMTSLAAQLVVAHAAAVGKRIELDERFMGLVEATIHASATDPTRLC